MLPLVPPLVCAAAAWALPQSADWLRLVAGLRQRRGFWWLDSALPGPPRGLYSFAGAEPWCTAQRRGARNFVQVHRAPHWLRNAAPASTCSAFELARQLLPPRRAIAIAADGAQLPFIGGLIAAFGYECAEAANNAAATDAADEPQAVLLGVDRLYAYDHQAQRGFALALCAAQSKAAAQRDADAAAKSLRNALPDAEPVPGWPAAPNTARAAQCRGAHSAARAKRYTRAVEHIRERIIAGDLYQACLTHCLELPFAGDPWAFYGALRARNPAPFAAYLELPGMTLAGSSPERFLRATPSGALESRPIKGTRPRGATPAEDLRLRAELEASQKDRAENLMIVDLVRNDLGRVAATGSVRVSELFAIESYATVFQMVSAVRAQLRRGCDALDAVRAAFPPGSMTGAPKLAAMSLLRKLEAARRGLYSGAAGYLDARGGADLSVIIRSACIRNGRAELHAGGGIVFDSDPHAEWAEAQQKARALLDALAAVQPHAPLR